MLGVYVRPCPYPRPLSPRAHPHAASEDHSRVLVHASPGARVCRRYDQDGRTDSDSRWSRNPAP